MMRSSYLAVASIIPTSMYVRETPVNLKLYPLFRRFLTGGIPFLVDAQHFCGATTSEGITMQLLIVYTRRSLLYDRRIIPGGM
jgi:hypothetical protein